MEVARRRFLASGACMIAMGTAGCSGEDDALSVTVVNQDTEERVVQIEIDEVFDEEVALSPDEEEIFEDAIEYPDEITEASIDLEIDGTRTATDFILSETLDELEIVIEGTDEVTLNRVSDQ